MLDSFEALVRQATGFTPYAYQRRIAEHGHPEVLEVPTGAGKTLAAVLPWLWRRRFHPDVAVREATPRRLVFALPMRVLVEQTVAAVERWLANLELDREVGLAALLGGERPTTDWRADPEADAVLIGTTDMLLSRALNRGYGESRYAWPISFGLVSNDAQWVFDEVQLMGAGLPTSRQLQALRERLGTVWPTRSMWMSATVPRTDLPTVDNPHAPEPLTIAAEDRTGVLGERLAATRDVHRMTQVDGDADKQEQHGDGVAAAVLAVHRPGTRTLVVHNTVGAARTSLHRLQRALGDDGPEVVLLHSRYRPPDRQARLNEALADVDPEGPGRVVVTTQVVEAGLDVSSAVLLTEACPWPSLVQRAGRCNRYGEHAEAVLGWFPPRQPAPYPEGDVAATAAELSRLEGQAVTGEGLADRDVAVTPPHHPVLRCGDLVELFDTAPDLTGADVDVAPYVRDVEDVDAAVAWRDMPDGVPEEEVAFPSRDERCPVPVGELADFLRRGALAWRYDHLTERWMRAGRQDARPGATLLVRADQGGYDPWTGWDPRRGEPVTPLTADETADDEEARQGLRADPLAFAAQWVPLATHLRDTERCAADLAAKVEGGDLPDGAAAAVTRAGLLHDLGKAHPVFENTMSRAASDEPEAQQEVRRAGPWGKSGGRQVRHERPHFRHELASALALLDAAASLLDDIDEADLARFLVGAHHGRVRLAVRSVPGELDPEGSDRRVTLGLVDGESLPAVDLGEGWAAPVSTLRLEATEIGADSARGRSWTARMLALRDRDDLGPFRLGLLEALVRVADWRASSQPSHALDDPLRSAEALR